MASNMQSSWYMQAFKSKPFQYIALSLVIVLIIYFIGRKSALLSVKMDQVDLPSNKDQLNTVTREQLEEMISDCKSYFDDISLVPGTTPFKISLIKRLLTLTDYELGLLNNLYNNRYAATGDNLYTEIENDWWGTEGAWRDKILARLRVIGAGKNSK